MIMFINASPSFGRVSFAEKMEQVYDLGQGFLNCGPWTP